MNTEVVVIPNERFFGAKTYNRFAAEAGHNQQYWRELPGEIELTDNDRSVFNQAAARFSGINIMAICADWCEDSLQAVPIAECIARAIDGIILRIFPVDDPENADLAQMWRKGDRSPIPKIVFLDDQMHEIGHMLEYPEANAPLVEAVKQEYESDTEDRLIPAIVELYRKTPQLRRNIIDFYQAILNSNTYSG